MAGEINWSVIDPTMPGKIANSFYEGQQQQRQNALQELAFKKAQQDMADDDAYRDAYRQSSGDINALQKLLGQKGLYKQANELTKQQLEMEAKRLGMKKDQAEIDSKTYKLGQDQTQDALVLLSSVKDQPSWAQAVATYKQMYPQANLQGLPEQYSPEIVQGLTRQLIGSKDASKLLPQYQTRNTGGTTDTLAIDPVTNQVTVANSVKNTMSPDAVASNQLGYARLGEEKRHNQVSESAPVFNAEAGGFVVKPNANNPSGSVIPVQGIQQKMTEDQSKATGWLIQADNAWKNMQSVAEKNKSATKPGVGDAVAAIPYTAGAAQALGNAMRSGDRQQFVQASSSLSEALLRAATGAGINAYEAKQKVDELTPQFGDSEAVVKQKMDAIPLYIESLKVRSGPGAKKAASVSTAQQTRQASGQIKFLGFE